MTAPASLVSVVEIAPEGPGGALIAGSGRIAARTAAKFPDCPARLRERINRDIAAEERSYSARRLRRELGRLAGFSDPAPAGAAPAAGYEQMQGERWAAVPELMAFYDESGLYGGPEVGADVSAEDRLFAFDIEASVTPEDRRFAFSAAGGAEGGYLQLCRESTGNTLPDEKLEIFRAAKARLLAQSLELTGRMEAEPDPASVALLVAEMSEAAASGGGCGRSAGEDFAATAADLAERFQCRRVTKFCLWRYYVHSGEVEILPMFRRIVFIPYVAQAVRAPMLAALEFWISSNPFARFWTFSSGVRVRLNGVGDRVQWLHDRLRRLNAQKFMRAAGARMVFRSTEVGTPEEDDRGLRGGGEIEVDRLGPWFHVHSHCVVEMAFGFVPDREWSEVLRKVGKFWKAPDGTKAWWGEGGAIRNAKECCKYLCKPAELLKLTGRELVALYGQLRRLKVCHPLGVLAEEIHDRRHPIDPVKRRRLVRASTPDGPVWKEQRDWNRHARRTRLESAQDAAGKLKLPAAQASIVLVARSVPGFGASGRCEPRVTLMGTHWNEANVRAIPAVARLIQATAGAWASVDRISVHNRTPTVQGTSGLSGSGGAGKLVGALHGREKESKWLMDF